MNNKAKFMVLFLSSKWMIWLDFNGGNKRKYGIGNKKEGRERIRNNLIHGAILIN